MKVESSHRGFTFLLGRDHVALYLLWPAATPSCLQAWAWIDLQGPCCIPCRITSLFLSSHGATCRLSYHDFEISTFPWWQAVVQKQIRRPLLMKGMLGWLRHCG